MQSIETFKGYKLTTAFQPIISIPHRRAVGFEALVRAQGSEQESCSPATLFSIPQTSEEHLALDRLCRQVHMHNFSRQQTNDEWLFINLDSESLSKEKPSPGFMSDLLSTTGISSNRVVIEILESEIHDKGYLNNIIDHFRSMGCLIAIDDFGAGHSNFDRIWELSPDIVKIDRNLVRRAAINSKIKRILSGMVSLIHEAGSLVIIEGIETEQEAIVAIESNTDMVQGFYFAMPDAMIKANDGLVKQIDLIDTIYQHQRQKDADTLTNYLDCFKDLFEQCGNKLENKVPLQFAVDSLLSAPKTMRCFLLDEKGHQIGKNIHSHQYRQNLDIRFAPVLIGNQANWSHKHYHYRALSQPDKINITRPYLSVAGADMCVTLSKAFVINHETFVLCCDVEWTDD